MLERLAVCLAILAGEPVAIAYVVAIKGLGRFAELKETPVAAERFIIGTLTSLLWAAGVAALAKVFFAEPDLSRCRRARAARPGGVRGRAPAGAGWVPGRQGDSVSV